MNKSKHPETSLTLVVRLVASEEWRPFTASNAHRNGIAVSSIRLPASGGFAPPERRTRRKQKPFAFEFEILSRQAAPVTEGKVPAECSGELLEAALSIVQTARRGELSEATGRAFVNRILRATKTRRNRCGHGARVSRKLAFRAETLTGVQDRREISNDHFPVSEVTR